MEEVGGEGRGSKEEIQRTTPRRGGLSKGGGGPTKTRLYSVSDEYTQRRVEYTQRRVETEVTMVKPSNVSQYHPYKCGTFDRLRCLTMTGGLGLHQQHVNGGGLTYYRDKSRGKSSSVGGPKGNSPT